MKIVESRRHILYCFVDTDTHLPTAWLNILFNTRDCLLRLISLSITLRFKNIH